MNIVKYIFKRKIERVLLWILFLASVFFMLKYSDEPILPMLKDSFIESVLSQFVYGNVLVYSISTGLITSLAFYLIVIYVPNRRQQKDMNPYIKEQCESIIFSSYMTINDICSKTGLDYNFKSLTTAQFEKICKSVNPKQHFSMFHGGIGNIYKNHLGFKLSNNWRGIENLLRLLPFIETGLIKKVYDLKKL